MADWTKKIMKAVGSDLAADEQLEDGMFVNPGGTTGRMMGRELGGLAGAVIANKMQAKREETAEHPSDTGTAASWPRQALVLGLTGKRMIMWSHSQMSGKPKEFVGEVPLEQIAGIDVEKNKATFAVSFLFTDGSGIVAEAPKVANKPERFAETFHRITGR